MLRRWWTRVSFEKRVHHLWVQPVGLVGRQNLRTGDEHRCVVNCDVLELVSGVGRELPNDLALPGAVGADDDVDRAGSEGVGGDGAVDDLAVVVDDLDRELREVGPLQVLDVDLADLAQRERDRCGRLRVVDDELCRTRNAREDVGGGELVGDRDLDVTGCDVAGGFVRAREERGSCHAGHRTEDDQTRSGSCAGATLVLGHRGADCGELGHESP